MCTAVNSTVVPLPYYEKQRQQVLDETGILEISGHEEFDRLTALASARFGTNYALVSMVDRDRNVFKSCMGMPDVPYTPREIAFCSYTIAQNDVMIVLDASRDARFLQNPLVSGMPGIRFYAGTPIIVDGMNIGAFSVFDETPRDGFSREDETQLRAMAMIVANHVEATRFEKMTSLELEEQVREKQRYLKNQEAERSRFVALLSHELRTPIHAVLGFADILTHAETHGQPLDYEKKLDYLAEIRAGGERMERLVGSALRFATADNGQMTLFEEKCCPVELAQSALSAVAVDAESRKVEARLENGLEGAPKLNADFTQTEQILCELLKNAIQASTPEETVSLHLSMDRDAVCFTIEDCGDGFDVPDISALTRPFATDTTLINKTAEGLGLGLPLADRLARLQNAEIRIDNKPEGGASVSLTFPAFRTLA